MNTRKLILLFTALSGLAATAFAETKTTEANVAKVIGAATVTTPDGVVSTLTAGMKIPQGSTIKTGADGDVYLESHAGYVTSIKKDSEVGVDEISVTTTEGKVTAETTTLNLKSGDLVAKLDPSKKAVNHYAVRTPKGVAAARGTVFTVQYNGSNVTIAVVNGVVSVVAPALFNSGSIFGGAFGEVGVNTSGDSQSVGPLGFNRTVSAGQALSQDLSQVNANLGTSSILSLGEWEAQQGQAGANSVRELMALAVATVAVAAQDGIGGTTAAEAAQVAQAVFAAVPSAAAESAALMKQSGVTNAAVTQAVSDQVPATQQAAFNSSLQSGTFTQDTVTTTTNSSNQPFHLPTQTTSTTPTATTPQPIDPSTVSRSH